jgi:peptidoglycan/xylan/chitin deacetylase (PgdA/CDA1 family)
VTGYPAAVSPSPPPALRRAVSRALACVERRFEFSRLLANRRNAVLMYHAIGDPDRYGNVSVDRFRRDLRYLCDRYEVVDLPEAIARPAAGPKRVALTFDDAYENFSRHALPVIREFDVPVTVFVPTAFVDGGRDDLAYRFALSPDDHPRYNDPDAHRAVDAPEPGVASSERLRELIADDRVTLGNHTRTHPDLARITDPDRLDREIRGAKAELEERFDVTVDRFCFPYGRYSPEALDVVRDSHRLAVTTEQGLLPDDDDDHRVPRVRAHVPETRFRWNLTDVRWGLSERLG